MLELHVHKLEVQKFTQDGAFALFFRLYSLLHSMPKEFFQVFRMCKIMRNAQKEVVWQCN